MDNRHNILTKLLVKSQGGEIRLVDHLCYLCLVIVMPLCLFIAALWPPVGRGLTSWLLFVMFNCTFVTFPCGILGQLWYLIADLCPLSYFDLTQLMTYCLTPIPYCFGTAIDFLAKTNKANSFSFLTKDTMDVPEPTVNVLNIEDGNALFYYMKETTDKFKKIAEKLYNNTIKSGNLICIQPLLLKLWKGSEEGHQTN